MSAAACSSRLSSTRWPLRAAAVLWLIAGAAGCAARYPETAPLPSPGALGDPRVEIAQLEQGIAARRSVLGLSPRGSVAEVLASEEPAEREDLGAKRQPGPFVPKTPAPAGAPPAPPPPPPAPPPRAPVQAEVSAGRSRVDTDDETPMAKQRRERRKVQEQLGSASATAARREASSERCRRVAQAADEICEAADRICRIASELREPSADESCRTARLDCIEARDAAMPCL